MDAPKPITPKNSTKQIETTFLEFNLAFNKYNFKCSFCDINNENIKIIFLSDKNKFETELSFNEFKLLNRYFKMSETIKELENDLIELNRANKFEISELSENKLNFCIYVLTLNNNKVIIPLKKVELDDKEKISLIIKENKEIKKENEEIKRKLNELNIKSIEQEKIIKENKKEIAILHKLVDDINKKLKEISNNKKEEKEKLVITNKSGREEVAKYLKNKLGFSNVAIESLDLDGESLFSLENSDVDELDELTNEEKIKSKYLINEIKKYN